MILNNAHRLWSVRLALLAGLVAAWIAAEPEKLTALVDAVPDRWRPLVSAAVGFVVFAAPVVARLLPQPGLTIASPFDRNRADQNPIK